MYIAFEGIEGSGKSIQIKLLEDYLKSKGIKYLITREPGSTIIGKEIRKILLNEGFSNMNKFTEIFLYLADRAEHFHKIIEPNLKKFDIILTDRSYFSTIVYQGFGRGIDINLLQQLNNIVTNKITLDYVFLFDLPVEIGINRALIRNKQFSDNESRFEKEKFEFHKKIREGYLYFAEKEKNWYIINAVQPIENISRILKEKISQWI
jgi:dTMP kinase